ncbi:hypothetical protein [Tuberibacillus sp. Marseille-P3662]|uniref:hypothetical protein n=1 Tax=Tuberibacillus sp. Marseille-P3662 TaxID=1965358 RepID=UPI000A1C8A05|nr:hypothetical protein [Tuberibacillus sp. Marseille-P3662]
MQKYHELEYTIQCHKRHLEWINREAWKYQDNHPRLKGFKSLFKRLNRRGAANRSDPPFS